jgi:hypothetical protein
MRVGVAVKWLLGVVLPLATAGCPALLSDDWRIVAPDASVRPEGSGAPSAETGIPDTVSMDAQADDESADGAAGAVDDVEANVLVDRIDAPGDAAIIEAVADVVADSPADGSICTPFPNGSTIGAPAGCSSGLNLLPAPTYIWAVAPWGCSFGLGTTQSNTPVECQCRESYNCACIMAHKGELNLCTCPTCAAVAYSCAETAGVPRLICPQ